MLVSRVATIDLKASPPEYTTARLESARLWNRMVRLHHYFRKRHLPWPTETRFKAHFKGRFALHSQSVQGLIERFFANIETTKTNRAKGDRKARYPYKSKQFVVPIWKQSAIRYAENYLSLSMGSGRARLSLPIPTLPDGEMTQVQLGFRQLYITLEREICEVERKPNSAAVDLGIIHLATVTDAKETLAVVGRGLRANAQWHNKTKAELISLRSRCKRGSRHWRKLARSVHKASRRRDNMQRNFLHHAANSIRDFAKEREIGTLYVGDVTEMNRGKRKKRSKRLNQEVGNVPWGQFVSYLEYKLAEAGCVVETKSEAYTSQTCPECGHTTKVSGRVYTCRECRFTAARDAVGSWNFLNKSVNGLIKPGAMVPSGRVKYLRPVRTKSDPNGVVRVACGKLFAMTLVLDDAVRDICEVHSTVSSAA